ncbi:hypothetical protein [Saccharopolyspora shandongensis]|uniref:hypothetical protein n=1 Tax=Saccharopolyspora shandongensis TaxID=418495 RepID=UPI0033FCC598
MLAPAQLDPAFGISARALHRPAGLPHIRSFLATTANCVDQRLAAELVTDVERLTERIDTFEHDLRAQDETLAPICWKCPGVPSSP